MLFQKPQMEIDAVPVSVAEEEEEGLFIKKRALLAKKWFF